jgi:predicted  nucleic acid-binding Zn-ribbon protein
VEALQLLLRLQAEDTSIDQIRHRRQAHPLRAQLEEMGSERQALEERHSEITGQLNDLASRQAALEADIEAAVGRAEALDKRLYSGEMADPKDLQAASDQVASLRRRQKSLEDDVLVLMEEREPLEAELAELDLKLSELSARSEQVGAELAEADGQLAAEESTHHQVRDELAPAIPAPLMAQYERLRQRLGGIGAAQVVNGACGGCHLALPPTELARIRQAGENEVVNCEQCGRILVRD